MNRQDIKLYNAINRCVYTANMQRFKTAKDARVHGAITRLLRVKKAYNWVAGAAGAAAGGTAGGLAGTWLADHVGLKEPTSMLGRFGRKALQYGGATAGIVGGSLLGKVNFGKIFGAGGGKRGQLLYDKAGKPITVDAKGKPLQLSQVDADKLLETRMSSFDKQYRARIANAKTPAEAKALRDNYQQVKQERLRGFRKQIYKKHGVNLENDPGAIQSAIGSVRNTLEPYTGLAGDIGTIGSTAFMVPSAIAAGYAGISALSSAMGNKNNTQQQPQQQGMMQPQQQGMMQPQQQGFAQQDDDGQQQQQQQQMTPQQYQQMMYQRQLMMQRQRQMMMQQQGGGYQ